MFDMKSNIGTLIIMENLSTAYLVSEEAVEEPIGQQEYGLIRRCQDGEPEAMEQIVFLYQNKVYNIAYGLLGNEEDAKDITQEAFLRVWEKAGQFQFRSSFSTWLYRIVVNLCNNERRRKKPDSSYMDVFDLGDQLSADTDTPESMVLMTEQQEMLKLALTKLKKKYREVIILRDMEGLSYEEISKIAGCSLGRVKSRLHQARMQLRQILVRQERGA